MVMSLVKGFVPMDLVQRKSLESWSKKRPEEVKHFPVGTLKRLRSVVFGRPQDNSMGIVDILASCALYPSLVPFPFPAQLSRSPWSLGTVSSEEVLRSSIFAV